jgi:hypothetical protein
VAGTPKHAGSQAEPGSEFATFKRRLALDRPLDPGCYTDRLCCVDSGDGAAMKGQNGEAAVCRIDAGITKLRNTTLETLRPLR